MFERAIQQFKNNNADLKKAGFKGIWDAITNPGSKKTLRINNPEYKQPVQTPGLFPDNNSVLATLFAETKGEPDNGVRATFDTIRNRSAKKNRPYVSTVAVPGQYSGYGNPDYSKAMEHLNGRGQLQQNALLELMRIKKIMEESQPLSPMDNRNLYLNPEMTLAQTGRLPSWSKTLPKIDTIGKHNYYYDPNAL